MGLVRKLKILALAIVLATGLAGCLGGGGGGSDSSVTAQDSEGLWVGTTNTGRNATAIVFNDGTYYMLYTGENNTLTRGVIQGSSSMSGNTLRSSDAKDFNLEGSGVLSARISGKVVTKSTLNADITYGGGVTVSFAGSYNSDYELQPLISSLVGQYSGEIVTSLGVEDVELTIFSDGSLLGLSETGCSVTGNLHERTDGNAYNVQITFANDFSLCAFPGQTYVGIAYYDADRAALYSAAPNATRTDGLLFVGTKS